MYRPLPNYLTIKKSNIDGLGLFSLDTIPCGTKIGITHVRDERFESGFIRTPLGGFFNHSIDPNCKVDEDGDFLLLVTIKNIEAGDEITVKYTLYNPIV